MPKIKIVTKIISRNKFETHIKSKHSSMVNICLFEPIGLKIGLPSSIIKCLKVEITGGFLKTLCI
jgi:hypothetical protein